MRDYDQLWKLTHDEQRELLGADIGASQPTFVIELDEFSTRKWYNEPFAPLCIIETDRFFRVVVYSLDDASLGMIWEIAKMEMPPHVARQKILEWLERSNFFVNLAGLYNFCKLFGKYQDDSN